MDLKHFSHKHPLKFNEETSHEGDEKAYCSGCGDPVSGPSFSCAACRFYLDKKCAEAPKRLNHPFHSKHSFHLLKRRPRSYSANAICDFCNKSCENFVYHCSCGRDLHVKCALFSCNIAEKRVGEVQHLAHIDPLISPANRNEELKVANCFVCLRPLLDSVYFSPDYGLYLHVKCANHPAEINHPFHLEHPLTFNCLDPGNFSCNICKQKKSRGFFYQCSSCDFFLHVECATLPTTINHLCHRKHPLNLQFIGGDLQCQMCQQTIHEVCAYRCSICKFSLHIECAPPPMVDDKSHQHHFIPFWRTNVSFVCDACGTPGKFVSYNCSTCSIMVHKKCISLPRILNHPWHFEHPIFHTHLLGQDQDEIETWECQICHLEEVNAKHARYHCSDCNYNVHVSCAIKEYNWYNFAESGKILEENSALLVPYSVIKEDKQGENVVATEIKHCGHEHNLTLRNDIKDDKFCDGCVEAISTSYYDCSQCNFSLHKSCAESPKKKRLWLHKHPDSHSLITSGSIFQCHNCECESGGFAYVCDRCNDRSTCFRCALVSARGYKCEGHEHLLSFYENCRVLCNACGYSAGTPYRCKVCNFSLHWECMKLPLKARHRSDKHPLELTYDDDNDYSESHYCDICEEERNPNQWFYRCATCNTSAHRDCALGPYPFIKLGRIYREWNYHPHPLTFVQKDFYYPKCDICREPCLSLALECREVECNGYIVCWECIKLINEKEQKNRKEDEEEEEDDEFEEEEEEQE